VLVGNRGADPGVFHLDGGVGSEGGDAKPVSTDRDRTVANVRSEKFFIWGL